MKKTTVGVIGCGVISEVYLNTMVQHFGELLRVKACASRGHTSALRRAEEFGIQAMSVEELLNDEEIEIVVNLTPAWAHAEIITRALQAGKHVYTEKTLAETFSQAKELSDLAADKGLTLCCAPDTVMSAGIQTARQALEEKRIGEITSCQLSMNRNYGALYEKLPFLLEPGAGGTMDVGPYFIGCATYLLGSICAVVGAADVSRPVRLNTKGEKYTIENENRCISLLQFESGVVGTLHMNMDSGGIEEPLCTIYGTEGVLKVHTPNRFCKKVELIRQKKEDLALVSGYTELLRGVGIGEMAAALQYGRCPIMHHGAALHTQEVVEAIYRSHETGQWQQISSRMPTSCRRAFSPEMIFEAK